MPLQLCPNPKGSSNNRHSKIYIIDLERVPESVWPDERMLLVATLIPTHPLSAFCSCCVAQCPDDFLERACKRHPEESCREATRQALLAKVSATRLYN